MGDESAPDTAPGRKTMKNYRIENDRVFYFDDYFFTKPQLMPDAHAATFESLGDWFARDARHVYFLHRLVAEAHAATFVVLGGYNDYWARDRDRAYWFWPTKAARRYQALPSRSVEAFEIVPHSRFKEYARDRESVFYRGKRIRSAHPQSFRILTCEFLGDPPDAPSLHFARDLARVFFDGKEIAGTDAERFLVIQPLGGGLELGVDPKGAFHKSYITGKLARLTHDALPAQVVEHFWRVVSGGRL